MNINLTIEKTANEGDLTNSYNPLQNLVATDGEIKGFDTNEIQCDLEHVTNLDVQPSYDGTVNLIINDDVHPPRIINSRFTKIEDNRFKIINRNQREQTNLYKEGVIDQQTRLFRNINNIPKFEFFGLQPFGQLMGGVYTFYLKFADNDYNKTDIVAESGKVHVFKGRYSDISSVSAAIVNERTDKAISLGINNIDTSFSKMYLYYVRESCDDNGIKVTSAAMIKEPYDIKSSHETIVVNGWEDIIEISEEELNIKYNVVSAVKTQAQVQNMLFFGNVSGVDVNVPDLQNISYYIEVACKNDDSVGYVDPKTYTVGGLDENCEYYSPRNLYYKLGYWPDEYYRLGIVYILKDDSVTPVFNLRGGFNISYQNFTFSNNDIDTNGRLKQVPKEGFNNKTNNLWGVFKTPNLQVIDGSENNRTVNPLYYEIKLPRQVCEELRDIGIKGYFIVRQKRIPTTLCQGLSIGVDTRSYVPMLYDGTEYFTESFLTEYNKLTHTFSQHIRKNKHKQCSGLLSLDPIVNPELQSYFNGETFIITPAYAKQGGSPLDLTPDDTNKRHYYLDGYTKVNNPNFVGAKVSFVDSDTPMLYYGGYKYSTRCGSAEDVSKFSFFSERNLTERYPNLLRGVYTAFLGTNVGLVDNEIYNIKVSGYSAANDREYIELRGKDQSPFFAASDRFELTVPSQNDPYAPKIKVYRGDCFTNTVTIRLNRNFVDPETPTNSEIIDENTWYDNFKGYNKTDNKDLSEGEGNDDAQNQDDKGTYTRINRADVNAVSLGMWVTFKCLSNFNLGLRAIDTSFSDERVLTGSARSFYPAYNISNTIINKNEDSRLCNQGYNSTVGNKRYIAAPNVPYLKDVFDNRIMFSNMQVEDNFKNAYRIFQGLSYKDIDRQYGAIVKLIPWGNNLLCIFEHGIGLVPVNEKALMQATTGQSIHMYGAGVLQSQITVISPDFGSIWQDSIIRTPKGVYGVDTYGKKIWRFSNNGFEILSDTKIQQYLNENIKLSEKDKYVAIGLRNVKSHFNNYKGDIMFTFYNEDKDTCWNICYNERIERWITRYSWVPLCSENINNTFISFDRERAKILAMIDENRQKTSGIKLMDGDNDFVTFNENFSGDSMTITIKKLGYDLVNDITYSITSVEYCAKVGEKDVKKIVPYNSEDSNNVFTISNTSLTIDRTNYSNIGTNIFNAPDAFHLLYFIIHIQASYNINVKTPENGSNTEVTGSFDDSVVVMITNDDISNKYSRNGVYVHGRAGIFDEIDYEDESFNNQILPTYWYETQHPFEFEFVVNGDTGLHKIFDNLVIISNNVQPEELEFEIIGDVYRFNKSMIYRNDKFGDGEPTNPNIAKPRVVIPDKPSNALSPSDWAPKNGFGSNSVRIKADRSVPRINGSKRYETLQTFENCEIKWDTTLNTYSIVMKQPCKNIEEFGRRLGNLQYREDAWYITIDPIAYREQYRTDNPGNSSEPSWIPVNSTDAPLKTVRLRDKFIKIRVRYTGEDLVVITALKTITTLSYA